MKNKLSHTLVFCIFAISIFSCSNFLNEKFNLGTVNGSSENFSYSYNSISQTLNITNAGTLDNFNISEVITEIQDLPTRKITTLNISGDFTGISPFTELTKIKTIYLRDTKIKDIPDSCFSNLTNLSTITLPETTEKIGSFAFSGCSSLNSISLPSSIKNMGQNVFSNCSSLSSIDLPSYIAEIGDNAFSGCSSLSNINLPSFITRIGDNAFSSCSSLSSIDLPSSIANMGQYVFSGCHVSINSTINPTSWNENWYIGNNATNYYTTTEGTSVTLVVYGSGSMENYTNADINEEPINNIGSTNAPWNSLPQINSIIIKGFTTIGRNAFNNLQYFKDNTNPQNIAVSIESNVNTILNGAFYKGCFAITIPNSVTIMQRKSIGSIKFKSTVVFDFTDTLERHIDIFGVFSEEGYICNPTRCFNSIELKTSNESISITDENFVNYPNIFQE